MVEPKKGNNKSPGSAVGRAKKRDFKRTASTGTGMG
mgnify:CR=1 FL=1